MLTSFVLRLLPRELAIGELVGEVVDVASGRQQVIRGVEDLLEFLRAIADPQERA